MKQEILDLIEKFKADPRYGPDWSYGERAAQLVTEGVEARDYRKLQALIYPGDAKFSREVFRILTGIKLPKTQRDSEVALREFATSESIEAYEWESLEKDAARAASYLRHKIIRHKQYSMNLKDFIDCAILDGFSAVEDVKVKGRNVVHLRRPDGTHYILKTWEEKTYARYAVAIAQKQLDPAPQ